MVKPSLTKTYLALLATAVVGAMLFYPQFWLSHDSSWYLVATRMFLDGKPLYTDIVEINPPLTFYVTAPALLLADFAELSDTAAYTIWVIGASAVSCLLQLCVVSSASIERRDRAVFLIGGLIGLFVLMINEFGQREHWLLIFALPYLYHLILGDKRESTSWQEAALLGLFAFFGLALKPYFLLIPAGIVLAGPIRTLPARIFAPANLALGAALAGYVAFILVVHLEYLTEIVPVATQVYGTFGLGAIIVLVRAQIGAVLLFAGLHWRAGLPTDGITLRLIGSIVGALLCYLAQFKGWNYQVIPLSFFLILGAGWLVYSGTSRANRGFLFGLLSILVILLTLGIQISRGPYNSRYAEEFAAFVDRPGESIVVLSTNVSASFPFVNEVQGKWSSRYPAQWIVPGALVRKTQTDCRSEAKQCAELDRILASTRAAMVEDFSRHRPQLVFVDDRERKSYFGGLEFDYIAFLMEDPEFAGLWSEYRRIGEAREYEVWRWAAPIPGEEPE